MLTKTVEFRMFAPTGLTKNVWPKFLRMALVKFKYRGVTWRIKRVAKFEIARDVFADIQLQSQKKGGAIVPLEPTPVPDGTRIRFRVHFGGYYTTLARICAWAFGNTQGVSWVAYNTRTDHERGGQLYWTCDHTDRSLRQSDAVRASDCLSAGLEVVTLAENHAREAARRAAESRPSEPSWKRNKRKRPHWA